MLLVGVAVREGLTEKVTFEFSLEQCLGRGRGKGIPGREDSMSKSA